MTTMEQPTIWSVASNSHFGKKRLRSVGQTQSDPRVKKVVGFLLAETLRERQLDATLHDNDGAADNLERCQQFSFWQKFWQKAAP
jgi:hypothetical protein